MSDARTHPVTDIVGIDPRQAAKLRMGGVETVADMWAHAGDRAGRSELAGTTGISVERLAEWAKRADLMRVEAIGPRSAALLEAAGVTSLRQLRHRSAEALHEALIQVNGKAKVVESPPSLDEVVGWIEQADAIAR
jgi:predicted flap endonuclease-1-like 5' DNA nuclease